MRRLPKSKGVQNKDRGFRIYHIFVELAAVVDGDLKTTLKVTVSTSFIT